MMTRFQDFVGAQNALTTQHSADHGAIIAAGFDSIAPLAAFAPESASARATSSNWGCTWVEDDALAASARATSSNWGCTWVEDDTHAASARATSSNWGCTWVEDDTFTG